MDINTAYKKQTQIHNAITNIKKSVTITSPKPATESGIPTLDVDVVDTKVVVDVGNIAGVEVVNAVDDADIAVAISLKLIRSLAI